MFLSYKLMSKRFPSLLFAISYLIAGIALDEKSFDFLIRAGRKCLNHMIIFATVL